MGAASSSYRLSQTFDSAPPFGFSGGLFRLMRVCDSNWGDFRFFSFDSPCRWEIEAAIDQVNPYAVVAAVESVPCRHS
ncbi:hypothetical protein L345_01297, partial [Ophiophagus hannah]